MTTALPQAMHSHTCDNCGAAVRASANCMAQRCSHCGAAVLVSVRVSDSQLSLHARAELDRVLRLRKQDGRLQVPSVCAAFAPVGHLDPLALGPAHELLQQMIASERSQPQPETAKVIEFLSQAIADHAMRQADTQRARWVLQSAHAVLPEDQGRQSIMAALAVVACRSGDVSTAESTLSACSATCLDLADDSAYRHARAMIEISRGNFAAVIRLLGAAPRQLPLHERYAASCAVMRAHAWEKLGRIETAVGQLMHWWHDANEVEYYRARRSLADGQGSLCSQSWPIATQRMRSRVTREHTSAWDLVGVAIGFIAGALFEVVVAAAVKVSIVGVAYAMVLLPLALVLLASARSTLVARRRREQMREGGILCLAQVLSVASLPNSPSVGVSLRVSPEDAPSYVAQTTRAASMAQSELLHPGKVVVVRVHPEDALLVEMLEGAR